jgi:hypothetical protein
MGRRLLVGLIGLAVIVALGCGASQSHHVRSSGTLGSEVAEEASRQPPTTGEVEQSMRASSRPEGRLSQVRCHELQGHHWSCLLRFVDGAVEVEQAVWYRAQRSIGISVVARKGHIVEPTPPTSRRKRHGSSTITLGNMQ